MQSTHFELMPIWIVAAVFVGLIVLVGAVVATIVVASSRRDDDS
jgi:hypothetical protein